MAETRTTPARFVRPIITHEMGWRRASRFSFLFIASMTFALASMPRSAATADLREAENQFLSGKYSDCVELTQEGVKEAYRREDWWLLRIRAQMAQGHYVQALDSVEAGLDKAANSIRLRWLGRDVARFNGNPERAQELHEEIDRLLRAQSWRYRVGGTDLVVVGHFSLEAGADPKTVLDGVWTSAQRSSSGRIPALLASGRLALDKDDFALAADFFSTAAKFSDNNADVQYGLARAFMPSDAQQAQAALNAALEINPAHVPSLLLVADQQIDREAYAEAEETLNRVLKINPHQPEAWAYRAVLAHLDADPETESEAVSKALSTWKKNPQVPHLIGRKLSRKYRFAEAASYQRRALDFDPEFRAAQIQLSQDLLRLGEEDPGWELATAVADNDPYNVLAYNLTTLQDRIATYEVLREGPFHVRMDATEAKLYGPRVLELLTEAASQLTAKYEVELPERVFVDIYAEQQDFAIRTFGLPGGAGFLGVCFGPVITMNSPAALRSTRSSWESVLWHEFAHVITLTKTNNRMPRWLSEGISVYEERLADARWGQTMTPSFRAMTLGDDFTPVSQLSGAFLSPESGEHLMFAYFESSLVVEYIVEEFGLAALNAVLDDLGRGLNINHALTRHTANIDDLDKSFAMYAKARAEAYAADADFEDLPLPPDISRENVESLLAAHPNNIGVLRQLVEIQLADRNREAAYETLARLLALFGESRPPVDLLRLKVQLEARLGKTLKSQETQQEIARLHADAITEFRELMDVAIGADDWPTAEHYARQMLAVDPMIAAPHDVLAKAAERTGDQDLAISSLQALAVLDSTDPAGLYFRIASLCSKAERWNDARLYALLAIEEAPRYRDAHRLLRQIVDHRSTQASELATKPTSEDRPSRFGGKASRPPDKSEKPEAKPAEASPKDDPASEEQPLTPALNF